MPKYDSIAIVGVGLLGGSIGLALRERNLAKKIIGIGREEEHLKQAQQQGCITQISMSLPQGVADAEIILICTPVHSVAKIVQEAAKGASDGAFITDVGSTKASIVEAIETHARASQAFVGSHPLAGGEKGGAAHARADLFQDRLTVLTPTERSNPKAIAAIGEFWESLGSKIMTMPPEEHDQVLASTSHAPHILSSLLAAITEKKDLPLVAGGWLDMTRIAAGDVDLWRQILLDNRDYSLKALRKFERLLSSFCDALESEDDQKITEILTKGKDHRDAVGN